MIFKKLIKKLFDKDNFSNIKIFIKIYALAISIFTIFRIILFINEFNKLGDATLWQVIQSFIIGLRFDIVICSYILIIPFFVFSIFLIFKIQNKVTKTIIFIPIFILFSLSFLVSAADIPYFNQFFSRFSITAFEWMNTPTFVIKMILEEPKYWLFSILFIISILTFYIFLKKILNYKTYNNFSKNLYLNILFSLLSLGIIFLGMRGRIEEKSPIRIGTAFFCNNAFLNQLGLNPNFTLIRSFLDSKNKDNININLMNNSVALSNVRNYLNIKDIDSVMPISRYMKYENNNKKYNVIIIIMESMSAAKMKRHGNNKNLTPFLDSLSEQSYYFENCYTAGMHTFNGIFSTIFSYPAIFRQHPMKESGMKKFNGIASTLKKNNYSTLYFTTHDGQFDNVEGFLKNNDFEKIITKNDYPSERIKTTLGVSDDYLFEFAIPILNQQYKKNKPFLSVFMTASDHGPYYIPDYFKPKNKNIKDQIVEYADFSLSKFIYLSKNQPWFDSTIFVFVADHGSAISNDYEVSLDYFHTPLIFYAPKFFQEKKVFSNIVGQIDVFPSIMSLLKINYSNQTMGIDIFNEQRPYIYFNADDKFCVIDEKWFLIVRLDKSFSLYNYKNSDKNDYSKIYPEIVNNMKIYAESHLQTYQFLLNKYIK